MSVPEPQEQKRDKASRRALRTARILFLYGLLVGGSVVFTLPFLWMIGTSMKVDREMFTERVRIFPMRPDPAPASPYLDTRYFETPREEGFRRIEATLHAALDNAEWPAGIRNPDQAPGILAAGIYQKLKNILPLSAWTEPDTALCERVEAAVTPEAINEVIRAVYRRLAFGTVRVRSFELQEKELTAGRAVSDIWTLPEGSTVRLVDNPAAGTPEAVLMYDFEDNDGEPIVLTADLQIPFKAERLFRFMLSITPDDTWHRVNFSLERNGRKYESTRPAFLGDFQTMVATLQEFGPDDLPDSNKIKLWYAYQEVDRGSQYDHGEHGVRVTLTLTQSSQLGAWWAKGHRNYRHALDYIPFWRYVSTSFVLVFLNIVGNIFSCSLVAYAFARLRWPGRNICFGIMLATMMIPPQVTMIPFFLIIKSVGLYNTLTPLWLLSFFGNAFNIFLLRQFMMGIPRDLEDAAKIDGCNFLQVYWYVMMPLIKPTLACIAIFTFMGVWNDFMGPLIFLSDQRLYPLSLGLFALNVQQEGNFGMLMAGSLLMTLPVIIIFFFAQRYFIQGITLTGTKG
jgi:multiple sugar transport system permease protein